MSFSLKRLFFGNWRNKIVALVFSVSIWSLAFRAETRKTTLGVVVTIQPIRVDETAILSVDDKESATEELSLVLSGSRKQIDELKTRAQVDAFTTTVQVPADEKVHVFQRDEFEFLPAGITVQEIRPATVQLRQEPLREREITDLGALVNVVDYDTKYSVRAEVLSASSLKVRAPESLVESLRIELPVKLRFGQESLQTKVRPQLKDLSGELAARTVRIYHEKHGWVRIADAEELSVRVSLQRSMVSWSTAAAEVYFELPLTRTSYRVVLNDAPPGSNTIPVKLTGPPEAIEELKPRVRLLVPLPPNFDVERGGTYTFTVDSLILLGAQGVRVSQHESRELERQSAWSYEVLVAPQ